MKSLNLKGSQLILNKKSNSNKNTRNEMGTDTNDYVTADHSPTSKNLLQQ